MPDRARALNRRSTLELVALLLIALGGVLLAMQQSRTGAKLDDLNRTSLGSQVIRCTNDLSDESKLDPTVRAICARAIDRAGAVLHP